jgi:hypothetical protein
MVAGWRHKPSRSSRERAVLGVEEILFLILENVVAAVEFGCLVVFGLCKWMMFIV